MTVFSDILARAADALPALAQMSLQGAVLIAAVLALRALFARRMAPGVLYALWLLPAARLLIPGSVESVFSMQNLISPAAEQRMVSVVRGGTTAAEAVPQPALPITGAGEAAAVPASPAAAPDLGTLLAAAWLIGAAAVLVYALWKNISFRRGAMRHAVPVEADCPLPVYLCENISSPCLCGVLRPVVLVNDAALENERYFDLALRHELTHYRQGDRFWALGRLLCCAVHWFNPLVWLGARQSVEDCERACDARVLRSADSAGRQAYGEMLLSFLRAPRQRGGFLCASSPMGGGRRGLRRRITLIAAVPVMKKTAAAALALCVGLTCLVACTGRVDDGALSRLRRQIIPDDMITNMTTGQTLLNYLQDKKWTEVDAETFDNEAGEGENIVFRYTGTCAGAEKESWEFSMVSGTLRTPMEEAGLAVGDACYIAVVTLGSGEQAYYLVPEADAAWGAAMAFADGEEAFHSPLPNGGEIAMVCSAPAMGTERHYLFYGEPEPALEELVGKPVYNYIPIYGDLDEQYPRVAEQMLFVSRDVGFVSFRFEFAETAPDLFRTADGGETWQRVTLPMGDISAENGYTGMHVTDIAFEDKKNGAITVSMAYGGGAADSLSCLFTTTDGGETWSAVTSGGPDISAGRGVSVALYQSNDSADGLVRSTVKLEALTAENLTAALVSAGAIPEGTTVRAFSYGGTQISLDLSGEFAAGVRQMGTAGESVILGSLVNTFLEAYGAESLNLTVDGAPLETGHNVYEEPFGYFVFEEGGVSWDAAAAPHTAAAAQGRVPAAQTESERVFSELVAGITLGAESCSDSGDISFTIPADLAVPEKLTISITGRQKMGEDNAMSRHFLENVQWTPGEIYTFNIGDKESYLSLSADIYYSYNGVYEYETAVDLLALLP